MGVNFTPIVDVEILSFTMGVNFTPIVDNSALEKMSKTMADTLDVEKQG